MADTPIETEPPPAAAGSGRAVAYGVLGVLRRCVAGPVTLLLIWRFFTPELQGYHFTFTSLLDLQVFVDLGLGQVLIQFAAHEWSRLRIDAGGGIAGDADALSRLSSLGRIALRWYAAAGLIVALGVGAGGWLFFSRSPHPEIGWQGAWVALCALTGLKLALVPLWSLLEGCNQVSAVYGYRLVEGFVTMAALWVAIALGGGLWAAPVSAAAGVLCGAVFLAARYRAFFSSIVRPPAGAVLRWDRDVWPLQWKIAVSWASGYFMFSLFTPVLFHYHGPEEAGRMGMTWNLVGALSAVSMVWVQARVPQFGMLIARGDWRELDRLFYRSAAASIGVAAAGALAAAGLLYGLHAWVGAAGAGAESRAVDVIRSFLDRLLPPGPTALLLAGTVAMQMSFPLSAYLRAHKREPFLGLSVAGGLLTGLSTWLLGRAWGATGVAARYLAVMAVVVVPVGAWIWRTCRREWHAPEGEGSGSESGKKSR